MFHWQNFESIPHIPDTEVSYYGGSVALADYCPYIQEFTWRSNNVVVRGSHCMYGENNPSKYLILYHSLKGITLPDEKYELSVVTRYFTF